jgi:small GTP-binding protein
MVKGIAQFGKRSTIHLQESILDIENKRGRVKFDETVLLCGAMGSGKTTLLHRLLFEKEGNWELPQTVTSTIPNIGYLNNNTMGVVRIIDYPGHSSQLSSTIASSEVSRMVFAIDATYPVTDAVLLLYKSILTNPKAWRDNNSLQILVVCTKTDLKGSKNYKRIKIQIRNELERLRKVDSVVGTNNGEGSLKGKNIDLDDLGVPIRLYFVEVALGHEDVGMDSVREFVESGTVPGSTNTK